MKKDVVGFIKDSIEKNSVVNPNQYGFKDLIDVFLELDIKLTESYLKLNKPILKEKTKTDIRTDIEVYFDGSYNIEDDVGGCAFVLIIKGKIIKKLKVKITKETSNRAEMLAAIYAIEYILTFNQFKNKEIKFYSDSRYVVKGITSWIDKWIINNWTTMRNTQVANVDLWKILHKLNKKLNIHWEHVNAHSGNKYNELVDELAKSAY